MSNKKRKLIAPIRSEITNVFAHEWDILDGERICRWTNDPNRTEQVTPQHKDKRPITISISSWVGTSPGAKHYNLTVEEQDNEWWCEKENAWVCLSCDSENGGFSLRASCYSEEEARELALVTLDIIFGKPRSKRRRLWRIIWND